MVISSPQTSNIKSWKQVGLDLGRPPTNTNSQVRGWQALQDPTPLKNASPITSKPAAAAATSPTKPKISEITPKTTTPTKVAPVIVTAKPSKTRLTQDVKLATTPKKRIVSDDHWKKERTSATASPQSAPISTQKVIPKGAIHGFAKTDGSPKYNAWARKREKSPPRTTKEEKIKESDSEEASPLDLLYWMTGKPKVPLPVRTTAHAHHVYEEPIPAGHVSEPVLRQRSPPRQSPPLSSERLRKRPILPALATRPERTPIPQRPSPASETISIDELPVKPHGTRIEAWLGRSSDRSRQLSSSSSEDDYSSPSMYSDRFRLPTRRLPSGHRDGKIRHEKENDHPRHEYDDEDDYFSTPRMPQPRRDDAEDASSGLISPLSPNSLRRRGAKRQSRSPRKVSTPQRREVSYAETQVTDSCEGYSETVYSTIENERHGPIKLVRRQAPALIDIPPRRVSNHIPTMTTSSKTTTSIEEDTFISNKQDLSNARLRTDRKITTEADLLSVLSIAEPGQNVLPRARPAPSSSNVEDILEDLKVDDEQYLKELKTLVDDVIPVLLSTALSKTNSKDMVGVFGSTSATSSSTDAIVNIGVALERMHGCHQRMPTTSVTAVLCWADNTHQVYADYLKAWRLGFQEIVINLPSKVNSATSATGIDFGDGVEKKRVNVAFLLKRPLIRVKYLARSIKQLSQTETSKSAMTCAAKYQDLVELAKRRQDEERARLEDEAAIGIDASQARNLHTLAAAIGVRIDPNRSVRARDYFNLQLQHSSGQRIDSSIELIIRDDKGTTGDGDILICEVGPGSRSLLFPPIQLSKTSARLGGDLEELVVMIRGLKSDGTEWYELLMLRSQDEPIIRDWHRMLGNVPMPPAVRRAPGTTEGPAGFEDTLSRRSVDDADISLGQRGDADGSYTLRHAFTSSDPSTDNTSTQSGGRGDRIHNDCRHTITSGSPRSVSGRAPPSVIYDRELSTPRSRARTGITDDLIEYGTSTHKSGSSPVIKRKAIPAGSSVSNATSTTATPERTSGMRPARPASIAPLSATLIPGSTERTSRRSSSPLKHEYRPDNSSTTVSDFDDDYSDDDRSISSESSADDFPLSPLEHWKPQYSQVSHTAYTASVTASLSPSDSASQAAQNRPFEAASSADKIFASLFYWSNRGCWDVVHSSECLIIVTPGLIEAFDASALSNGQPQSTNLRNPSIRPIIALELTPLVPIRRGTALDISIRSPPTSTSTFQDGNNILFRSRNGQECAALYAAINQARINNPTYIAMQNARGGPPEGSSNWAEYMDARRPDGGVSKNISSWWRFGTSKKSSYRKSEHTSSLAQTDGSGGVVSSAFKRFGRAKSQRTGRQSKSTDYSTSSGAASPPIMASMGIAHHGAATGITNKPIRLYLRESAAKWRDMGSAYLTVLHPERPAIIAPTGHLLQEKRVLVTSKHGGNVLLDVTAGETSFERVARTGLAVSVVEELEGGAAGDKGGVGGSKGRVFMIQMKSEAEAAYTFSLVGRLRY